jgi:hypothetical protein
MKVTVNEKHKARVKNSEKQSGWEAKLSRKRKLRKDEF